jgi:hypothetical protein
VPFGLLTSANYEIPLGAVDGVLKTSWSRTEVGALKAVKRPKLADTCDSNDRPRVYGLKLCKVLRCLIWTMRCGINLVNMLRTKADHRNKQSIYYVLFGSKQCSTIANVGLPRLLVTPAHLVAALCRPPRFISPYSFLRILAQANAETTSAQTVTVRSLLSFVLYITRRQHNEDWER